MTTIKDIHALLPQTQCGECGYKGCEPYAMALAQGVAPIDRCPPGGAETVIALAGLLHQDPAPYLESARKNTRPPALARIEESECIGCTKCIQACPVDAIIGSAKQMHAIIETECTGCGLCIEPCPVDCIELVELPEPNYDRKTAAKHYEARQIRHLKEEQANEQTLRQKNDFAKNVETKQARQQFIAEALLRVKAKNE